MTRKSHTDCPHRKVGWVSNLEYASTLEAPCCRVLSYPLDTLLQELICYELKQGFLHGERVTSMSRRRYRLKGHGANECLMLIHYRRSEDADRVLVDESQVRYPPRRYPLAPIPAPVGSNLTSRSQAGIMNVPSSEGSSIRSLPNPATSVPTLQQRAPHTPSKKKTVTGLKFMNLYLVNGTMPLPAITAKISHIIAIGK